MTTVRDYKVNRLLWETFEATLLAHGKRLVKDMAGTLQVNEKELVKRVFPSKDSFRVSLLDTEFSCCLAFVEQGEVAARCRKPSVTGLAFCSLHAAKRQACSAAIPVRRVQDRCDLPALWLLETDVMDSSGSVQGTWNEETNQLFLVS